MTESFWLLRNIHIGVCALLFAGALLRGAAPERILAGTLLAVPLIDSVYHLATGAPPTYRRIDLPHVALDAGALVIFTAVAVRANRIYPLWIGAAQIIALVAHFARAALTTSAPLAFAIMHRTPIYIQIVATILGLGFHIARMRRSGRGYRSWTVRNG